MASGDSRQDQPGGEEDRPRAFDAVNPGRAGVAEAARGVVCVAEATFSPFHCLYQDALEFHTQSHLRLARSEAEASRMARAAFLLYLSSAEALVHQAARELGRPEIARLLHDAERPLSLAQVWRMLPAAVAEGDPGFEDLNVPPWPQFAELLAMRTSWAYPGLDAERRAYYHQRSDGDGSYEPLEVHQVPAGMPLPSAAIVYPRTGLPRDPYALRPRHLDTARSVLDAAIATLDRRMGGALTRRGRHRREPLRIIYPPGGAT